jgi:hypothetical protein
MKVDKTDVVYWSNILLFSVIFTAGLMTGSFGVGVIPFAAWAVLAHVVVWRLNEYVFRTHMAIKNTGSMELKKKMARRAMSVFFRIALVFGFGLLAVALMNHIYQLRISTILDTDFIFYGAAIFSYYLLYLRGYNRAFYLFYYEAVRTH